MLTTVLFDLDNTLYPAHSGVSATLDRLMTEFVRRTCRVSPAEAEQLRQGYMARYGTTMRGLQLEHGVEVERYLRAVHSSDVESLLARDVRLAAALAALPLRKQIFTNAPTEHAARVLAALGIGHHFDHVFDIRFARYVPKPDVAFYHAALRVLDVAPHQVVLVEDTARNIPPARELGMTTIFIGAAPAVAVDVAVPDIYAAIAWLQQRG
ncbi:MAG: pyrimidine 5'-nucleotidase [Chloroflexi bacterium]|jgi:putative hydrolase of the HAD superfamily|nr:pyrimidine 5'-nucleotidase [Chloroflexota bacterium]